MAGTLIGIDKGMNRIVRTVLVLALVFNAAVLAAEPPERVIKLEASQSIWPGEVHLRWSFAAASCPFHRCGVVLYRDGNPIWQSRAETAFTALPMSYVDKNTRDRQHRYHLQAYYRLDGEQQERPYGPVSNRAIGIAGDDDLLPVGLSATQGEHTDKIVIQWESVPEAAYYQLHRNGELLVQLDTAYYADRDISPEVTYNYVAEAYSSAGIQLGVSSGQVSGHVSRKLPPPEDIAASQGDITYAVQLNWKPVKHAERYALYKDGKYIGISRSTSYRDEAAIPGVSHRYQVASSNAAGIHALSQAVTGYATLEPPSSIQATQGERTGDIQITWSESQDAATYDIYRDDVYLDTVQGNVLSYTDVELEDVEPHRYSVRAGTGLAVSTLGSDAVGYANAPPDAVGGEMSVIMNQYITGYQPVIEDRNERDHHALEILSAPLNGDAAVDRNGITYMPDKDYVGLDSFEVRVTDRAGESVQGMVYINVTSSLYASMRLREQVTVDEDVATAPFVPVIPGDGDPGKLYTLSVIRPPRSGVISTPDNQLVYLPDINFHGSDRFTVLLTDEQGYAISAQIDVTVNPINDPPTAITGTLEVYPGKAVEAYRPDIEDVDLPDDRHLLEIIGPVRSGEFSVTDFGVLRYTPDKGVTEDFTVAIAAIDKQGERIEGTLAVMFLARNTPPSAVFASIVTDEDVKSEPTPITVEDDDPVDTHVISIIQPGKHGYAFLQDQSLIYIPDDDYHGNDEIRLKATDEAGDSVEGVVSVIVQPVEDKPIAEPGQITVLEGQASVPYRPRVVDPDGDHLTLSIKGQPAFGRALIEDEHIVYIPDLGYVGDDQLIYEARDPQGNVDTGLIKIQVEGQIKADIYAENTEGKAPFTAHIYTRFNHHHPEPHLHEVQWFVQKDGGDWVETKGTPHYLDLTLDEGSYFIRAVITDSRNMAASETNSLSLQAYKDLEIKITGNQYSWPGTPMTLTAEVSLAGKRLSDADVDVQWESPSGLYSLGTTAEINRNEPGAEDISVKARLKKDKALWHHRVVRVNFDKPQPPRPLITVDDEFQYGRRHIIVASVESTHEPRKLPQEIAARTQGEWVLPDGSRQRKKRVIYSPTDEDVERGTVEMEYRSWIAGYEKAGALTTVKIVREVSSFQWPEFSMELRYKAETDPATVQVLVSHNSRDTLTQSILKKEAQVEFYLPRSRDVRISQKGQFFMVAEFLAPGAYPVKVTIRDKRGHLTVLEKTVMVKPATPMEIDFREYYSNRYMREPLTLYLQPVVEGMHPSDSIARFRFLVDGKYFTSNRHRVSIPLKAGKHTVRYDIITRSGKRLSKSRAYTVKENRLPTCRIGTQDRKSIKRAYIYPICNDPDGRMVSYWWQINNDQLGERPNIQKPYTDRFKANVTLIATDDSGGRIKIEDSFVFGDQSVHAGTQPPR